MLRRCAAVAAQRRQTESVSPARGMHLENWRDSKRYPEA